MATRAWRERDHPRNPEDGQFIEAGPPGMVGRVMSSHWAAEVNAQVDERHSQGSGPSPHANDPQDAPGALPYGSKDLGGMLADGHRDERVGPSGRNEITRRMDQVYGYHDSETGMWTGTGRVRATSSQVVVSATIHSPDSSVAGHYEGFWSMHDGKLTLGHTKLKMKEQDDAFAARWLEQIHNHARSEGMQVAEIGMDVEVGRKAMAELGFDYGGRIGRAKTTL